MLHILSTHDLYVPPDQWDAFEALRMQLLRDIQPVNQVQTEFTNTLIRATWEIRRCNFAEKQLGAELGGDPLLATETTAIRRLRLIQRTRLLAEREKRMALQELKKLQTDHAIRRIDDYRGLLELPVPVQAKALVAAARQAGGYQKHERLTFAPVAKMMNQQASKQGLGTTAWEAWLQHQAAPPPPAQAAVP